MKKYLSYVLGFMLIALSFSCYYDELVEEVIEDLPDDVTVSFAMDIEPLFSQGGKDCTQCHNGGTDPDLRAGNAYDAIVPDYVVPGNAEASSLYQNLPGRGHPFDVGFALNSDELALIKAWIDRGAEDN